MTLTAFRTRAGFAGATLLFGFALAGCTVGPAYRRPTVTLPSSFSATVPGQSSAWPAARWWRSFGSATLDDYVRQALAGSDDIAAAVARVREADAQARIAGAALLPAVGVQGSATRERNFVVSGSRAPFDEYSPVASASYELDFWGRNRAARRAAVLAAEASRYDHETVVLTVLSGVATDYFEALEMRDRLQVADQDLANAQTILSDLQLEQQVGTVTALDVAQQAAEVAVVNATIPPLQEQLRQSMNALAILLGRTPESLHFQDAGLASIQAPQVGAGLPSQLLARRPDVGSAEAQLHAANANIVMARAAFFPSIDLTATGGFASTVLTSLISPANDIYSVTGALAQDIFQGGALTGQYRYSQARYTELLADYHKAVLSALQDVENALVAVHQTGEQEQREQNAVDKARSAYDFAQMQMAAGVTNILTVLNTETTLFTAQDQLVQVKYQHLSALVQLYQALGGGWQQGQTGQKT